MVGLVIRPRVMSQLSDWAVWWLWKLLGRAER